MGDRKVKTPWLAPTAAQQHHNWDHRGIKAINVSSDPNMTYKTSVDVLSAASSSLSRFGNSFGATPKLPLLSYPRTCSFWVKPTHFVPNLNSCRTGQGIILQILLEQRTPKPNTFLGSTVRSFPSPAPPKNSLEVQGACPQPQTVFSKQRGQQNVTQGRPVTKSKALVRQ